MESAVSQNVDAKTYSLLAIWTYYANFSQFARHVSVFPMDKDAQQVHTISYIVNTFAYEERRRQSSCE